MMVESEAYELTEAEMLGAVKFGHDAMQPVIDLIIDLAEDCRERALRLPVARLFGALRQGEIAGRDADARRLCACATSRNAPTPFRPPRKPRSRRA
jgi:hypothetical protein